MISKCRFLHCINQNVRHFLLAGQIYYETTRDIDAGEELLLGPKASIEI